MFAEKQLSDKYCQYTLIKCCILNIQLEWHEKTKNTYKFWWAELYLPILTLLLLRCHYWACAHRIINAENSVLCSLMVYFFFYHFCSNSEHLRTMPSFKVASWWSSHLNPNFSRSELTCLYSRAGFRNMPGLLLAETRPCYLYSWQHIRNDDAADFNVT